MTDAFREYSGIDVMSMSDEELKSAVKKYGGEIKGDDIRGLAINEHL